MRFIIKNVSLKNIFKNCLSGAIVVSFWLFIAALPPFRIGIWVDSECVLVAAHIIFAIIGLSLCILCAVEKNLFCSRHTLVFAGFALISLVATLWAKNPLVHHLGTPLLGEGSILFCGLSLLSFGFDNISKKNTVHWSAIFAGLIAGSLVFLHHPRHGLNINPDWLPYVFGAFLAPIALGIYTISTLSTSKIKQLILLILSSLLLFLSFNKTAWVAVSAVICIWPLIKKLKVSDTVQKYICVCIPFVSVLAIYFLSNWPFFSSLESRKFAIQSYVLEWKDKPFSLLLGNGWGYYFENLQKHITELPVAFFRDHSWNPSWDGIDRLDFHCMHFGTESLFSIGIIGLIFYIALILTPFAEKNLKEKQFNVFLFVVFFSCLTSTWFTLMCVWPFFILGFSTLNQEKFVITKAPLPLLWLCIATVLCVHGAVTYWQTAVLYPANSKSLFFRFTNSKKLPSTEVIKESYNYQGFHLGHFILNTLKRIKKVPSRIVSAELNVVFRAYDAKTSPLVLDVAMLHGMKYFQGNNKEKQNILESVALAVLQKAPKRSDLLVSYVKDLIENHQLSKAHSFIDTMLIGNANDPFALWLMGIYQIHEENIEKGKFLMIQALNQGIEKWIYIPKDLKNQLKEKPLL